MRKENKCYKMGNLNEIKTKLKKYGQEHLLLFYDKMDDDQKEKLKIKLKI